MEDPTLEELIRNKGSKYNAKKLIRKKSRQTYLASTKPKCCVRCGCVDCFEVDHIMAISKFSLDTKVRDITQIDNLQALCPTCHSLKSLYEDVRIVYL